MKVPFDAYTNDFDDSDDDGSVQNLSGEELFQEDEAVETAETKNDSDQEFDPLKSYLKGISTLPLLTKEGEVEIARRIELGKERIEGALFIIPFVLKKLIMLGHLVESGEAPLIDLIQDGEDLSEEDILEEKERFSRITTEIAALADKRQQIIKSTVVRNREPGRRASGKASSPETKLTENKALIIAKIKQLNLRSDVVNAFLKSCGR